MEPCACIPYFVNPKFNQVKKKTTENALQDLGV